MNFYQIKNSQKPYSINIGRLEFDALIVEGNLQRSCKFSLENKASTRKVQSTFRVCMIYVSCGTFEESTSSVRKMHSIFRTYSMNDDKQKVNFTLPS